jgi:hypothetical protein
LARRSSFPRGFLKRRLKSYLRRRLEKNSKESTLVISLSSLSPKVRKE